LVNIVRLDPSLCCSLLGDNMRRVALFAVWLLVLACETHKCRYPTNGFMEIGEVRGTMCLYGHDPDDYYLVRNTYAFLSRQNFSTMPNYHNAMAYMNGIIVRIASVRANGEYIFPDVPPGCYYLNIGSFDSSGFPFMSYHSITPYLEVERGEQFEVPHIELLPGGQTSLVWYLDGRDSSNQGFNFSQGVNVSYREIADLWLDGENQKLVADGKNIAIMPPEPEGLCYISSVPDTGYVSEAFFPLGEPEDTIQHFVVITRDGKYAKCRKTGAGCSSHQGTVWRRQIDIEWMLQPDGSKDFSY
jgi:hypothetical protein